MEPALDNWRDELKKYFRSIEIISETALKSIKRDRTRNNLPFDDALKDFILKRTSARIAHVYTNLQYEESLILEDEKMLFSPNFNHQNNGNGLTSKGRQMTSMTIDPESIEQMPVILVQSSTQSLASSITPNSMIVQDGHQMSDQIIISMPSNQLQPLDPSELEVNQNPEQELRAFKNIRTETVTNESLIECNSSKNTENMMAKRVKGLDMDMDMESTSIGAHRSKCDEKIVKSNANEPKTIDLTSDQEDVADSLDNYHSNDGQIQPNVQRQKVSEARIAGNSKGNEIGKNLKFNRCSIAQPSHISENRIESSKIDRNFEQQSKIPTPKNADGLITSDDGIKSTSTNGQIQPVVIPGTNVESNSKKLSKDSIGDRVAKDNEQRHGQEDRQEVDGGCENYDTMVNGNLKNKPKSSNAVNANKRHKCDFCEYCSAIKSNLKHHIRTHTNERPFECKICEKRFNQKQSLNNHMKTHRNMFKFQCSNCHQGFSNKVLWKSHENRCKSKQYECYLCSKKFYQHKQHLLHHMRIHHTGEKPFGCTVCQKQFCSKSNLTKHMKLRH